MILAAAVLWCWLAGPLLPDLPPTTIEYLGRPGTGGVSAYDIGAMVHVRPAAAEVVAFKGAFNIGSTAALQTALDAAPMAGTVSFDSPGGRPLAAQAVADLILKRHLSTAVDHYCASACTIAYLAGETRTASPAARFAFHLGTGPILASLAATVVVQIERKWFIRAGASLSFAERALHAPNLAPYVPAIDELIAAGYVHRTMPLLAGASLTKSSPPDPLLEAVAAIEPSTSAALIWGIGERERAGMTGPRSLAIADQRAGLVVNRWLRHSSDTAVLELVDATVTALQQMLARDPVACMQWQIGLNDQDTAAAGLPLPLLARYHAAQAQVLLDANAFPLSTPVDNGGFAAADAMVRADVAQRFGTTALAAAASRERGFEDPARSCAADLAYLIGLRSRAQAAPLLRWALAAG